MVSEFYKSVRQAPAVSDKDMSLIMSEHSAVRLNEQLINIMFFKSHQTQQLTVPVTAVELVVIPIVCENYV